MPAASARGERRAARRPHSPAAVRYDAERNPGRPRGLFDRQGDKPMCQYQQQAPEFRPGPAEAASRLRMQSALLSLTIIVNILCLLLNKFYRKLKKVPNFTSCTTASSLMLTAK